MRAIPARATLPGDHIEWDGITGTVRKVEYAQEPGFVWLTVDPPTQPGHVRPGPEFLRIANDENIQVKE